MNRSGAEISARRLAGAPVLCLGGLDPAGAAGLLADARMVEACGGHPLALVTLDTAQTRTRFVAARPTPRDWLQRQWQALLAEERPAAVKIGALADVDQARWLAEVLQDYDGPVVIDPVLSSSSGGRLGDPEALRLLAPRAWLLTPNRAEAATLFGLDADDPRWRAGCPAPLLVTGADHARQRGQARVEHRLLRPQGLQRFETELRSGRYRGSGCLLATAIACALACGQALPDACAGALETVDRWLAAAVRFDDGIHLPRRPA